MVSFSHAWSQSTLLPSLLFSCTKLFQLSSSRLASFPMKTRTMHPSDPSLHQCDVVLIKICCSPQLQPVIESKPALACSSRAPAWKSHSYDQACSRFLHSSAPTCSSMDVLFPMHTVSCSPMAMLLHLQHEHAISASILIISPQQLPHSTLAIKSHEQEARKEGGFTVFFLKRRKEIATRGLFF